MIHPFIHPFHTRSLKSLVLLTLTLLLSSCNSDSDDHSPQAQSSTGSGEVLSSITISPGTTSMDIQMTRQFTAVGIFSDGSSTILTESVTWSTSDESIVSISETGVAIAHAQGEATITATRDGVSGTCLVSVSLSGTSDTSDPAPPEKPDLLPPASAVIIDHTATDIYAVPDEWIEQARESLCIAYGHTSHGSQIIEGMKGLVDFSGSSYAFNASGAGGALELRDTPFAGANDLGNPDRTAWAEATRAYLDEHPEVNVVMWSWCGQVSDATKADIDTYLHLMSTLEQEYPDVRFVYMTGHLDGTGLEGNLHQRNEQIRRYCRQNGKILYDFADIESYDPDGVFYGDRYANDACDYDSDGDGDRDANWAEQWQNAHVQGQDWYDCYAAHSQPLNANLKAYAAWWLWARIAGWDGR